MQIKSQDGPVLIGREAAAFARGHVLHREIGDVGDGDKAGLTVFSISGGIQRQGAVFHANHARGGGDSPAYGLTGGGAARVGMGGGPDFAAGFAIVALLPAAARAALASGVL